MNERHERIEQLAGRWMEARTTEAEERELRELLRRETDLPDSLRDVALLFAGFEALADERMPDAGRAEGCADEPSGVALPDVPSGVTLPDGGRDGVRHSEASTAGRLRLGLRRRRRTLGWMAAAAAVAAVGILLGVELLRKPYCYIDGRPVYDREEALQTTAYFDSFAALDAPQQLLDDLIENQ